MCLHEFLTGCYGALIPIKYSTTISTGPQQMLQFQHCVFVLLYKMHAGIICFEFWFVVNFTTSMYGYVFDGCQTVKSVSMP